MKKSILTVSFDDETGSYSVSIPQGSSVQETAFAMSVIVRCLHRDGMVARQEEFIDLINHYCNDSQYEEIKETNNEN